MTNAFDVAKETLYSRRNDVTESLNDYDPTDPDFEDTYGEGYHDRLCDEQIFLLNILDMIEKS